MNNAFIKIIGAIFLVLIAVVLYPVARERFQSEKSAKIAAPASVDFSPFTKDAVSKIRIAKGNDEKVLEVRDGIWMIGQDEADEAKIDQLFADFSTLAVKDMVSENEENHAKFEVTKDTGYTVTISANGKDSVFFIGKLAQGANGFYLRKEGIRNVYVATGSLSAKIAWTQDEWKKK